MTFDRTDILPGIVAIMALSRVYAIWGDVGFVFCPRGGLGLALALANRHSGRLAFYLGRLRTLFRLDIPLGPFMERLRANKALSAALSAVTAGVVGVILNLAILFMIHVVWREVARLETGRCRWSGR